MRALIAGLGLLAFLTGCGDGGSATPRDSAPPVVARTGFPSDRPDVMLTLRPHVTGAQMRDLLTERLVRMDGVAVVEGDYGGRVVRVTLEADLTPPQRTALEEALRALPEVDAG